MATNFETLSVVGKNDFRIAPRHSSSGAWPGHFFKLKLYLSFGELGQSMEIWRSMDSSIDALS